VESEQSTGTVTGLLGNIVDDTVHFVDDLMHRVNEAEIDTRNAVSGLVEAGEGQGSDQNMAALQAQLNELQTKMQELGAKKARTN
jgi:hypothetical protein